MLNRQQSGFTLIEIAIVLVIIGLLLGGVLKGQELINSARVRNMADQNTAVQAAYFGFIDRYRQIPGDMLAATACTSIGSAIDAVGCAAASSTVGGNAAGQGQNNQIDAWSEAGAVWPHLAVSGFLKGTFTGNTAAAAAYETGTLATPPVIMPNAFRNPIFLGFSDDYENNGVANPTVRLLYAFGAGAPASILRELDVKLDDSLPGTGVVRATLSAANANGGETGGSTDFGASGTPGSEVIISDVLTNPNTCTNTPNTATSTWNVDSDNDRCNAMFLY